MANNYLYNNSHFSAQDLQKYIERPTSGKINVSLQDEYDALKVKTEILKWMEIGFLDLGPKNYNLRIHFPFILRVLFIAHMFLMWK